MRKEKSYKAHSPVQIERNCLWQMNYVVSFTSTKWIFCRLFLITAGSISDEWTEHYNRTASMPHNSNNMCQGLPARSLPLMVCVMLASCLGVSWGGLLPGTWVHTCGSWSCLLLKQKCLLQSAPDCQTSRSVYWFLSRCLCRTFQHYRSPVFLWPYRLSTHDLSEFSLDTETGVRSQNLLGNLNGGKTFTYTSRSTESYLAIFSQKGQLFYYYVSIYNLFY